jgi:hypothetical protein
MIKLLLGLIVSYSMAAGITLWGTNSDVDTGTLPEDVWAGGGAYSFPSAASASVVLSSSANDTSAGTGARTVRVSGLGANYVLLHEDATMNGTASVSLTSQFLRVNEIKALTVGSNAVNAGAIQVKHGSTVIGEMAASKGISGHGFYTMPQRGYIKAWQITAGGASNSRVTAELQVREPSGSWITKSTLSAATNGATDSHQYFDNPLPLPVGSDVRVRVIDVGADNTSISAHVDILF